MNLTGELRARLDWDGDRVQSVALSSTRTSLAARLLAGRQVAQAVRTVPLLYSVCARSQSVASVLAAEAALGIAASTPTRRARARLVEAEIMSETLWRALIDWPRILGDTPMTLTMGRVRECVRILAPDLGNAAVAGGAVPRPPDGADLTAALDELRTIAAQEVFGMTAERWSEAPPKARASGNAITPTTKLLRALATLATPDDPVAVNLMPDIDANAASSVLAPALDADRNFELTPLWNGTAVETGALARHRNHGRVVSALRNSNLALARITARLVELASLLRQPPAQNPPELAGSLRLREGDAISWVQTARGLLVHRMTLEGPQVARYRIVAPTEWNFHPRGAFSAGLSQLHATTPEAIEKAATLLVQSLDPCVNCVIEVHRA